MVFVRDPEASKKRILEEAEKEFAEKGLSGASVNVIALKARINKRMIYHYFSSKEGLYEEILRRNILKITEMAQEYFDEDRDPVAGVRSMVTEYYNFLRHNPEYVKIMAWEEVSGGQTVKKIFPDLLPLNYKRLENFYIRGCEQKVFRKDIDLMQLIVSVIGVCAFTFARREMYFGIFPEKEVGKMLDKRLDHILELIFEGILEESK